MKIIMNFCVSVPFLCMFIVMSQVCEHLALCGIVQIVPDGISYNTDIYRKAQHSNLVINVQINTR